MSGWLKQFLADYLPWTIVDLFVYSTKGKLILVSAGLAVVSGLAFLLAPFSEPGWRLILFTALTCFSLTALGTAGLVALMAYGMPSRSTLVIGALFLTTWIALYAHMRLSKVYVPI
jgi:hypothetical protein